MKTTFWVTVAAIALAAGSAGATPLRPVNVHHVKLKPAGVLYSQYDDYGLAVPSENFTSGTYPNYDSAGADDFAIPAGAKWTITELDALGVFGGGPTCDAGPDCNTSEVITFYKNNNYGHPGTVKYSVTLSCTAGYYYGDQVYDGNLACTIPGRRGRGLRLSGGTSGRQYWVSVTPYMNFSTTGQWSWATNQTTRNFAGQWQNPANGFQRNCTTWTNTHTCWNFNDRYGDDYVFSLIGTSQ